MAKSDRDPGKFEVLIVDDQAHMRAVLRDLIQAKFPGYAVADTGNGRQGLKLVQELRPRLVLMDVGLPDANGIVLTARITALLPGTRVIIVCDYAGQAYVDRAHAAGAFGFVTKEKIHTELPQLIALALTGSDHP